MKIIQPKPDHSSPIKVPAEKRVHCPVPVTMVRYRYAHHSAPSGYDRICDYLDADEVRLPDSLYWAGETVLRPWAFWVAGTCGIFEYSRYDCIQEQAVILHAQRATPRIYHFVYGEKSFVRSGAALAARGHRIVLTVHHPEENVRKYFRGFGHLRHVSRILTMDHAMIPRWNEYAGRDIAQWIPHGVDCDYFRPVIREETGVKTIVFAGTHARDIETLTQTVEALAADSALRFRLLSKHPAVIALGERFENVEVIRWLDDDGYRVFLCKADLLLLPLKMSTVCNVVLEALACGVPVVTTQGGISAYLDDRSSTLVAPGEIDGWCAAVMDQIGRGQGARLCARAQAEKFDWVAIAQLHAAVYNDLVRIKKPEEERF